MVDEEIVAGPGESGQEGNAQFDDIEWELTCSEREASVGYTPFADLDFASAGTKMAKRSTRTGPKFKRIVR